MFFSYYLLVLLFVLKQGKNVLKQCMKYVGRTATSNVDPFIKDWIRIQFFSWVGSDVEILLRFRIEQFFCLLDPYF